MIANVCLYMMAAVLAASAPTPASQPTTQPASPADAAPSGMPTGFEGLQFTARFTRSELQAVLIERNEMLPLPFHFAQQREAYLQAVERIAMGALAERLTPFLTTEFPKGFDVRRDLISRPVAPEEQAELQVPDLAPPVYRGPTQEVLGFLVHDVTERDFARIAIRALQAARMLLETGDPVADRTSALYMHALAGREVATLRAGQTAAAAAAATREAARQRIAKALGIYDAKTNTYGGTPNWAKESRRFTYVVKEGNFIERLAPLVTRINADLQLAGFEPPSPLDRPGVHFDVDLRDVEIVLPRPMLETFLSQADRLEQRMAEDHIISVEAVRLTDRDIVNGAIASRLNVLSVGVHDVQRNLNQQAAFKQFGINSLLAVANRQLQVNNLQGIQAGLLPAGSNPLALPSLTLQPAAGDRKVTEVGGDFSVGADDIFFDGREQRYGFSYIGPDGLEHQLSLDVVDSLRQFWDRIERNLIVHKIKRTETPTDFTVPVGPAGKTFKGIASLISQENQDIVITSDNGALIKLSATAGTWLVIQDFQIEPTPGSSTDLTEEERQMIENRVLLTMFLRDPRISTDIKARLVETQSIEDFEREIEPLFGGYRDLPVREGRMAPSYQEIFDERTYEALEDAAIEKKERNSKINLNFYSSQGNIIRMPGTTELGDANDLTSFTTELTPNVVTPISSFFTKSASGAEGSSPLTGVRKGEQSSEEKTMTHLVIRVRFPTKERERKDRDEGRHLGYFNLPLSRTPHSLVDLPFLSSSEHPLERLAKLRPGLMFDALQRERVKKPLELINPNSLQGTISADVYETATTRMLMNRRIISNSPSARLAVANRYRDRFNIEVRSLLEFDEVFFDAPNLALRNMAQWNNAERIVLALHNSPGRFALQRLVQMIDELGEELVPLDFAEQYLAVAPTSFWGRHRIYPLSEHELQSLRRDVANHYLRIQEVYGDSFLDAISQLLELGTYRTDSRRELLANPFRGYHDLVIFSHTGLQEAMPHKFEEAYDQFTLLKRGGYSDGFFGSSLQTLEDLNSAYRKYILRGREILRNSDRWTFLGN